MAQVGDKFVIEIGSVINGEESGCPQYRIKGFDKVFFDDKGLKNLDKYEDPDDACKFGAEYAWHFANKIMNMPIHERAEMFDVSHNNASFKDISEKFTVDEAIDRYKQYVNKNPNKENIEAKLLRFAKENNITIKELKILSKQLLRSGINNL